MASRRLDDPKKVKDLVKSKFKGLNIFELDDYYARICPLVSQVVDPNGEWIDNRSYAYGCSYKTWEKFVQGKPIRNDTFNAYCEVIGIDPNDVTKDKLAGNLARIDWGQAPDLETFYGREEELAELIQWAVWDRCRLISIVGFAGIGKTKLSLKLAHQVEEEFEYIIWRKLYDTLPLESLLKELIKFVSDEREVELDTTKEGLTKQLLQYLKERRCLLIFDEIERIGQGNRAGSYQKEYEDFFHCIGTIEHLSCVLLTSRVKFSCLETKGSLVRSLKLSGLDTETGREIFQDIEQKSNCEFQGTEKDWQHLISCYQGNPLALEIVAKFVLNNITYRGNLTQFLAQDLRLITDVKQIFNNQFDLLTSDEQTIMYWLALNREGISMDKLREYLVFNTEKSFLPQTLQDLDRKVPIETSGDRLTLHSSLMEYLTERIIEKVCEEVTSRRLQLFNTHALIQVSAKHYIKDEQIRLILLPIIDRLEESFGLEPENSLENRLPQLLKNLNRTFRGYRAGNLINLMHYAGISIEGRDFSGMPIWEADLNINLQNVNFMGCRFDRCSFSQNLGWINEIALHPQQDLIAVADGFGLLRLFDFDGQTRLIFEIKDDEDITALAFSPDGRWLACSSCAIGIKTTYFGQDSTIRIWNTDTGDLYRTFIAERHRLFSVAFSPDGQTVASGGDDTNRRKNGTINLNLWHIRTGEYRTLQQEYIPSNRDSNITSPIFHRRENLLACNSDAFCMWNTATEELLYTLDDFGDWGKTFDFHPTEKILVIGCFDGTIKVLNAETKDVLKTWKGHSGQVFFVSFSSDGQKIVSVGQDVTTSKIKVWNVETTERLKTSTVDVLDDDIIQSMSQKNLLAISPGYPPWLKLWNVDTEKYFKIWEGHNIGDHIVAISPDGQTVVSRRLNGIYGDNTIIVWVDGRLISTWGFDWGFGCFSPDAQTLIRLDDDCIEWRKVKTGEVQQTFKHPLVRKTSRLKQSTDGRFIAGYNRLLESVVVWNVRTKEYWNVELDVTGNFVFSNNGQYLASIDLRSSNNTTKTIIKILNVETGKFHHRNFVLSHDKYIKVVFHPNDRLLIAWAGERTIFWDWETGESKSIQTFENYNYKYVDTNWVHDLFFDEEGNTFIVSNFDRTIEIWQIDTAEIWSADTAARRIRVLEGHSSTVKEVKATPDGQNLVSCDKDGVILRWDLATQQTPKLIYSERPYEGMNISDATGLTSAQKAALIAGGAVEI